MPRPPRRVGTLPPCRASTPQPRKSGEVYEEVSELDRLSDLSFQLNHCAVALTDRWSRRQRILGLANQMLALLITYYQRRNTGVLCTPHSMIVREAQGFFGTWLAHQNDGMNMEFLLAQTGPIEFLATKEDVDRINLGVLAVNRWLQNRMPRDTEN